MNPIALFQIETIKTSRRVAFWVSLLTYLLFGTLFLFFAFHGNMNVNGQEVSGMILPRDWSTLLSQFRSLGNIFIPISIILLSAGEFTYKTARQNVIDGLSKEAYFVSKLISVFMFTLIYFLISLLLVIMFNATVERSAIETPDAIIGSGELLLFTANFFTLFSYGILALFFAFITRSAGTGISFFVLYFVLEGLASGLFQLSEKLSSLPAFFPMKMIDNLSKPLRFDNETLQKLQEQIAQAKSMGQTIPESVLSQLPLFDTPTAFLVVLAYVLTIAFMTYFIFKQRDL